MTKTAAVDLEYYERAKNGQFDLVSLYNTHSEWGVRARPSKVGLTLSDIAIGTYGDVPDHPPRRTMAPRGSDVDADVPDMGYTINDKAEVWSDNVMELYEEAVSRQWSATRDIAWGELPELDPDLEHAMCQFATLLSEVEMIASDFPAKWLWRINHDFVEAKMFLCTQVMDEARHSEVFRKRALAGGGGLGKAKTVVEEFLKVILDAENYDEGSALMHLLAEGLVLSIFRAGELLAPSDVEKKIFRLCMQDEARHVAYGTMHLRYRLERDPSLAEDFHAYLDRGEEIISVLFTTPSVVEPAAILAAGSLAAAEEIGLNASDLVRTRVVDEYLARCDRAGLPRRGRMQIPSAILAGTDGYRASDVPDVPRDPTIGPLDDPERIETS
ncbi:MAG: ferritin-like domain-containing protein [Actinobacteria bacterium]|nr:ferritin-like domain-containing protein [Actinomycetota bacterium]